MLPDVKPSPGCPRAAPAIDPKAQGAAFDLDQGASLSTGCLSFFSLRSGCRLRESYSSHLFCSPRRRVSNLSRGYISRFPKRGLQQRDPQFCSLHAASSVEAPLLQTPYVNLKISRDSLNSSCNSPKHHQRSPVHDSICQSYLHVGTFGHLLGYTTGSAADRLDPPPVGPREPNGESV